MSAAFRSPGGVGEDLAQSYTAAMSVRTRYLPRKGVWPLAQSELLAWLPGGALLVGGSLWLAGDDMPWWLYPILGASLVAGFVVAARRVERRFADYQLVLEDKFVEQSDSEAGIRIARGDVSGVIELPGRGLEIHGPQGIVFIPEALEDFAEIREALSSWAPVIRGAGTLKRAIPGLLLSAAALLLLGLAAIGARGGAGK